MEVEIATYAASYVFVRIAAVSAFGVLVWRVLAKRHKAATHKVAIAAYACQAHAIAGDRC